MLLLLLRSCLCVVCSACRFNLAMLFWYALTKPKGKHMLCTFILMFYVVVVFFRLIIICKRKLMFNIFILFHLWNWNKEKYAVWKDCLTLKPYFEIMNTGLYFGSKPEKWTNCYSCFLGYLMSRSILDEAVHCMYEWRIELFPVVVVVALFTFINVKIRKKYAPIRKWL